MSTKTLPNLYKNFQSLGSQSIGFDPLFEALSQFTTAGVPSYPPYNITKSGDTSYQIVVAAAGFSRDEITIEHDDHELSIKSHKAPSDDKPMFIHRGLALRDFHLKFKVADDVEVIDATFVDGLLSVNLKHIMAITKPKMIPIQ